MRTAEHMEHRNLERKWRPSFALGPHLTEGRLIMNDKRCLSLLRGCYERERNTRRLLSIDMPLTVWEPRSAFVPAIP